VKIAVFDNPTVVRRFLSRESREHPDKPYIARNQSHWATSSLLIVWVYLHLNFRGGLAKRMYFETSCAMAV